MGASCGLHDVPCRRGLLTCSVSRDWQPDTPPLCIFQHNYHESKGRPGYGDSSSIGTIHPTQRSPLCSQRGIDAASVQNHRGTIAEPSRNQQRTKKVPTRNLSARSLRGIPRHGKTAVVAMLTFECFHRAAVWKKVFGVFRDRFPFRTQHCITMEGPGLAVKATMVAITLLAAEDGLLPP